MAESKPYYAVIFTSTRTVGDRGYNKMSRLMQSLAEKQSGFLGVESAREELGITVSYWQDLKSIANWKTQTDHLLAQERGIKEWYSWYKVRICRVEREYDFNKLDQ
ncbi:heme-degrading monooxygenase HmoA [Flavobacteriaceae bacterium MAR_2009_75]|nr:heme-degrading monooxygenase HmoA [Flavobacteriaceae bacterium MAR_2009_75]